MRDVCFRNGTIILVDCLVAAGQVLTQGARIAAVGDSSFDLDQTEVVDLAGGYLAPGFVDLHVHGGAGHDFMDGTDEAFRGVCQAHARHGTTALLPTTTV